MVAQSRKARLEWPTTVTLMEECHLSRWDPAMHVARGARWGTALEALQILRRRGLRNSLSIHNSVMHSCAAEQQWKETLTLLRGAALQPSRVSYSTSITAAGRAQRWRLSVEAFESLQERLQCNVVTFGAIIGACEKGSQWRQSLRLLGRLQREDLEPNVIACSAVISACAKGDQWQLALQLLAHVVETRLEPNVQTYTAAISSCREHWLQALQLLLEMQESHLQANIITYSAVISCCPWHWALQLLMELEEGHLRSDVVLCNTVLRACEGQPSVVLALYSRLQLLGLADHVTYSTAINACGWQDAMLLLQQMHGQRLPGNVVVYNAGLKSCESSSAWQGAMKILEMMQAQGVPSDSITCSAAVSACRSAEQNDVALGIFWEMVAAKVEANVVSFTAAITACCDHRWPLALHLLSQLQDVDVVACNAAISAVSTTRFGEWVQALQLFRDMELQRIKANDKTYGALAKAFERGRQWQRALDLSTLGDGVPAGAAVSALSESAPMAPLLANLEDRARTSPALLGHAGSEKAPANLWIFEDFLGNCWRMGSWRRDWKLDVVPH